MTSIAATEKTYWHFSFVVPLAELPRDGWSAENEAAATCFCGTVQLSFMGPSLPHRINTGSQAHSAPGLVDSFVCNCANCHKITASVFASNFHR